MLLLPPASCATARRAGRVGFSLVEVALAITLFATVLLGMLALLANGVSTRTEVRRDTIGVQLCHQVHQALRGYRMGIDNLQPAVPGTESGLLDEFLPFDFAQFPGAGKSAFVLGFDNEGKQRGRAVAADYEEGTTQEGVSYLVTLEGKPVTGKPGLTEVVIGVEFPAGEAKRGRKRQEFRVLMTPRAASDTANQEAAP